MHFLKRIKNSKNFKQSIIILFLAFSAITWIGFKIYDYYFINTDNAYINANIVQIAPRVTGKIIQLHVNNNQYVKKDQPLFDIDPEPFQLAVNLAQAQLNLSNAELDNAILSKDRITKLAENKFVSTQENDNAIANYKTAIAKVEQAKANLDQANLNLQYTKTSAPTSGWITNMSAVVGDIVPANQPLFALISDEEFWADANFKETELQNIKPGQAATIITDLYPSHSFSGVVESISGGTGSVFSLLPPQNATGNWVKITQRVPVRVRVLHPDPRYPLRIGISAKVTVQLHHYLAQENQSS